LSPSGQQARIRTQREFGDNLSEGEHVVCSPLILILATMQFSKFMLPETEPQRAPEAPSAGKTPRTLSGQPN